jgi:hypothetical protein
MADWFERLTGFREGTYEATRAKLEISNQRLTSLENGKSYSIGHFELVSLAGLRERAGSERCVPGSLRVSLVQGDVRELHSASEYRGALFQVASQFNALEMTGPNVTPEDGVTRYQYDHTQGPACAIAAGAATIYRNYFVPLNGAFGQTAHRQLDGLADIGQDLSKRLGAPVDTFWDMRNGYALCRRGGLDLITNHIASLEATEVDALRGKLRIGIQTDIEVTDAPKEAGQLVSQAFCSALPIAYTSVPERHWRTFATLVLEAAYEATMLAALSNMSRGASDIVLLTMVGGGAFGNDESLILSAIRRALSSVREFPLDVRFVCYSAASPMLCSLVKSFQR